MFHGGIEQYFNVVLRKGHNCMMIFNEIQIGKNESTQRSPLLFELEEIWEAAKDHQIAFA